MNFRKNYEKNYFYLVRITAAAAILIFLLTPLSARSGDWDLKPLRIAIGISQPPYIIKAQHKGMEYEIVEETLRMAGYKMFPRFVNYGDEPEMITENKVDGAMTMKADSGAKAHYSDVYIVYHNYAITLGSSSLKINSISDLEGKSVLAFQDADLYLGSEFKKVVKNNPDYRETPFQYRQNLDLYMGRVNVVIADINIFNWYNDDIQVTDNVDTDVKVDYHDIFPATNYRLAFRDEKVRDDFNKAFARLKSSGKYKEIADKYNLKK